ncbi:MAG TPA: hypothetical protein VKD90_12655 [Gemmataceae bacterium]|nr:hypothetical protein [Gemmataceae bacterium]
MARQNRRFVPRLHAFDERVLPSVSVSYSPSDGVLLIQGTAADDVIAITDTGKGDPGSVTVFDHGTAVFTSEGPVGQIMVVTGNGADTVDYRLTSDLATNRQITVDLGAGNDKFAAHLDGQTLGANFLMQALGRRGSDRLTLDAQHVSVGAGTWLTVNFQGGAGSDAVKFNYLPDFVDPTGVVKFTADQRIR